MKGMFAGGLSHLSIRAAADLTRYVIGWIGTIMYLAAIIVIGAMLITVIVTTTGIM